MSANNPANDPPPSDKDTPTQDRGLFHHEAKKHESHHYLRMYGGQVVQAAMFGFGATLGADAANAAVGDMKVCRSSHLRPSFGRANADCFLLQEWWRH